MSFLDRWLGTDTEPAPEISRSLAWPEFQSYFSFNGSQYGLTGRSSMPGEPEEEIGPDFAALCQYAFKQNGIVFALVLARMKVFSEARFQFRRVRNGKPGELFGTSALRKLERPWPNGTTSDLLARMEEDASLAGNFFGLDRGNVIRRMRPDWVTIVMGTRNDVPANEIKWDVDAEVIGYAYTPGGYSSGRDPQFFRVEEVAHYYPIPDPEARFRGMSWLEPITQEIMADKSMTKHRLRYFEHGGTPNIVVEFDTEVVKNMADFKLWTDAVKAQLGDIGNQYQALFLGAGTKANIVGSTLEQLEFKVTQGGGETRMAAAAGVPPIVAGFSEGLEAATYSNYGQARRHFADSTLRWLWRSAAGSLQTIIDLPPGAELAFDFSEVAFLQEDRKDAVDIQAVQAVMITSLRNAGYDSESVIKAVTSGDFTQLEDTGLLSVQLQPPGTQLPMNGTKALDPPEPVAGKG